MQERLFFAKGLATGIDRVTSECDTAKMSINKHFASKDGLICAVLREVQTSLLGNLRSHALHSEILPIEQLEAAFNILCYAMSDPEVRAGLIVRTLVEFPQPRHPVHQAALDVERAILDFLQPLAAAAGIPESEAATRQLLLLAKGYFVMSSTVGIAGSRMLATTLASNALRRAAAQLESLGQEVAQP